MINHNAMDPTPLAACLHLASVEISLMYRSSVRTRAVTPGQSKDPPVPALWLGSIPPSTLLESKTLYHVVSQELRTESQTRLPLACKRQCCQICGLTCLQCYTRPHHQLSGVTPKWTSKWTLRSHCLLEVCSQEDDHTSRSSQRDHTGIEQDAVTRLLRTLCNGWAGACCTISN